jgi:CheY-like chemotaxis protein
MSPANKTVIYVDDDEDDRDIFTEVFRSVRPDLDLVLAKDGPDALEKLRIFTNPICIYIDMNMPKMNGMQFLSIVKTQPHLANIPAFILTTALTPRQTEELSTIGAQDFLIKPSSLLEFRNLLINNLQKHFNSVRG